MLTYKGDMHIHSDFSKRGFVSINNVVETAKAKNLDFIALTDTVDFRIQSVDEVTNRIKERNRLADILEEESGIKIIKGIEVSDPHFYKEELKSIKKKLEIDYILGSIHYISGSSISKNKLKKDIYIKYYERLLEIVKDSDIDAVSHLDYIRRYINEQEFDMSLLESIYKEMIKRNIALEINTSGYRDHLGTLPKKEFIDLYKELGGEKIVIGSSSHYSHEICDHFNEACEILEPYNFDQGYVLKRKFKSLK